MADTSPLLEGERQTSVERKKRSTLLSVCPFILGNEFCERLAYYGLATNFITYLTRIMGIDAAAAAIEVMVFEGTAYITPLLGAYMADSHWGRYKTILVFSLVYLVGMVLLTLTSWFPGLTPAVGAEATFLQNAVLVGALGVIALGTGGIKPNVSAFGADQFDETDPKDKKEKASFFNWFYLAINMGSLISCTVVVYVQDSISWTLGFIIPAIAMGCALLLFLAGSSRYRHIAPTESPMARVVKVVWSALKNRWHGPRPNSGVSVLAPDSEADSSLHRALFYQRASGAGASSMNDGLLLGPDGLYGNGALGKLPLPRGGPQRGDRGQDVPTPTKSYKWLEDAITEWQTSQGHLVLAGEGPHGGYTPQQVEEVKMVLRLLPIFWVTVLYWTIYAMMGTMFIQQGSMMERNVQLPWTNMSVYIPSATMALFNTGAIIIMVPLYDGLFEPWVRKVFKTFTLLQKIGWGMVIAALAMFYGAGVEGWRLQLYRSLHPDSQDVQPPESVPLSIMWQAPSYILIALSEVFASIGQLEFFYDQAPDVMRSCSMALQLLSTAVGSYLGGALVAAVAAATKAMGDPWLPRDLNHGHMDYFLLLMGVLMTINTVVFVWVAMCYEYKAVEHRPVVKVRTTMDDQLPLSVAATQVAGGAITMDAAAARRSQYHYRGSDEEAQDLYSRSLAYFPPSPALPAPFR